jgi:hypothetical protein
MERGKIKPDMMMDSVGFLATSGNRVKRAVLLGQSGFYVAWRDKPTEKDSDEFIKWFEAKYPHHVAKGRIDRNPEQAKQEYQKWLETQTEPAD